MVLVPRSPFGPEIISRCVDERGEEMREVVRSDLVTFTLPARHFPLFTILGHDLSCILTRSTHSVSNQIQDGSVWVAIRQ